MQIEIVSFKKSLSDLFSLDYIVFSFFLIAKSVLMVTANT